MICGERIAPVFDQAGEIQRVGVVRIGGDEALAHGARRFSFAALPRGLGGGQGCLRCLRWRRGVAGSLGGRHEGERFHGFG